MNKVLLASAAAMILITAAPAQEIPTLSQFLSSCYRDSGACRTKMKDYITASETQKIICLPKDVSVSEAISSTLSWLRSDSTHPAALNDGPFDDALFEATTKLYPCAAPPAPPVPPPAEPSADPATPPAQ